MRMGCYETPKEGEEAGNDSSATGDNIVGMLHARVNKQNDFMHFKTKKG